MFYGFALNVVDEYNDFSAFPRAEENVVRKISEETRLTISNDQYQSPLLKSWRRHVAYDLLRDRFVMSAESALAIRNYWKREN